MISLRCKYCRRKAVDFAHHLPVCCDHGGMKFWRQHGRQYIAIAELETNHLLTIVKNLVHAAQKDWAQSAFEELLASEELRAEGTVDIPNLDKDLSFHSHYLLERLIQEVEKRGYQCPG